MERFVAKGADVNATNKNGETALMFAAQKNHIDAVRLCLDKGADVNARNGNDETALALAEKEDNTDIVNLLKSVGAE